ncbi:MAG TPA: hypothetical protein VGB73_13650 [Pyrinomonadaceae bacterium]|jgi:hypothetical protein
MHEENGQRKISETEFKRLCHSVWAARLTQFDERGAPRSPLEEERDMLRAVLLRLVKLLNLHNEETASIFRSAASIESAQAYRSAIDAVIKRRVAAPFDYEKILGRLLREVLTASVA